MENRKTIEGGYLNPKNCNKAKCKTCIFGPTPLNLSNGRKAEITQYLITGLSSHICHSTNLTCYGALELQAKTFHQLHIIPLPTVSSLLEAANLVLGKVKK